MFLDLIDFFNANPVLIIVALFGHIAYDYIQSRQHREFRATMYDFRKDSEKHDAVTVEKLEHLDECVDGLKQQINLGLAEHIKETWKH